VTTPGVTLVATQCDPLAAPPLKLLSSAGTTTESSEPEDVDECFKMKPQQSKY